jgi:hypothetical protein
MTPSAQDILDMMLDGDPVAWQISREGNDIRVVALLPDGSERPISVPIAAPTIDSDSCV